MRHRFGQLLIGLMTAVVVFAAVPAVLATTVGIPIPRHDDQLDLTSLRALYDALDVVAWLAWAGCCLPILRAVVRRVRRRDGSPPNGRLLTEHLAARIAAAVLAVVPVGTSAVLLDSAGGSAPMVAAPFPSPAGPGHRPVDEAAVPVSAPLPPTAGATPVAGPAVPSEASAPYTVGAGDSLWSIADRLYGDGADWPAIAALNYGRLMGDGLRFVDPRLILPGWTLLVPAVTSEDAAEGGAIGPAPPPLAPPETVAPPLLSPTPTGAAPSQPAHGGRPVGVERTTSGPADAGVAHLATAEPVLTVPTSPPGVGDRPGPSAGPSAPFPELASLGLGVIVAAALSRRMRQRRRENQVTRRDGERPLPPSDSAADLSAAVMRFEGVPAVDLLELANRHLAASVDAQHSHSEVPAVRALRIGSDGVDAWLDRDTSWAPDGWTLTEAGHRWHLPAHTAHDALRSAAIGQPAWLPVLLPVGEDDAGSWLVSLEPGGCLPILGTSGEGLLAAMRLSLAVWPWSGQVLVTDRAAVAEREARLNGRDGGAERLRTVFVGEPDALTAEALAHCSIITTAAVPPTDLTVLVDERAATLHPIGVTVRPQRLTGETVTVTDELLAAPTPAAASRPAPGPAPSRVPNGRRPVDRAGAAPGAGAATSDVNGDPVSVGGDAGGNGSAPQSVGRDPGSVGGALEARALEVGALEAGPLEVRLLTPVPRIDGLARPLPANRARRAVELVAYLALHRPDAVSGDRLRTRVLGSADADAAAKTLFNTAAAARRSLGTDPSGAPVLPPAGRSGYRVSSALQVDAGRAEELVAAARRAADPEAAMALYRAALELVEGEPLAGVQSGFGWWQAEGHAGRVGAVLVDGACALAGLASDAGLRELAFWAVDRGRLLEPYHEGLARAALAAAAAADDADLMRREWTDLQRRMDELQPGTLPSARTERLFIELSRRLVENGNGREPGLAG